MYSFTDLNSVPQEWVSSVAMSVNGIQLDNDKFKTLTVEGRDLIGNTLSYFPEIPSRDGAQVQTEKVPIRTLKVKFYAKESEYARINALLRTGEDLELRFADEPEFFFLGRLQGAATKLIENTGEITFVCANPYKFGDIKQVSSPVVLESPYPLEIVKIKVTLTQATNKIVISNRGKSIIINGEFAADDVIEVTRDMITQNGQNILSNLDFAQSDYHEFKIYNGDEVTANGSITISGREKWL